MNNHSQEMTAASCFYTCQFTLCVCFLHSPPVHHLVTCLDGEGILLATSAPKLYGHLKIIFIDI